MNAAIMSLAWFILVVSAPQPVIDGLKATEKIYGEELIYDVAGAAIGQTFYGIWRPRKILDNPGGKIIRTEREGKPIGIATMGYCVKETYTKYESGKGGIIVFGERVKNTEKLVTVRVNLPNGDIWEWRAKEGIECGYGGLK